MLMLLPLNASFSLRSWPRPPPPPLPHPLTNPSPRFSYLATWSLCRHFSLTSSLHRGEVVVRENLALSFSFLHLFFGWGVGWGGARDF